MYLNASTDKIEIVLGGTVATNQLQWNVSYQDITSSGMTLPQSGGAGLTNNATAVDIVAAPAASTTRQVTQINVYNADTATATVTIQKDVSGTNYVLISYAVVSGDTLMWSREDGWRLMSAASGGAITLLGDVTGTGIGTVTTTIANDAVTTSKILNDNVTYAKIQNVSAASKLLGRGSAGGSGNVEEITLGTGLTMTGTTLDATGGGGGISAIGTINSQTKSANGAVISGTDLVMQTADATNPGLVSTGTQTFAGSKTFSSAPTFSSLTAGSVLFAGTGGLVSEDVATFSYDTVNNVLDVGNPAVGGGSFTPEIRLSTSINNDASAPAVFIRKNRPVGQVQSGDTIGYLRWGTFSGIGGSYRIIANILTKASQNHSSTVAGTQMEFQTMLNGGLTLATRATISGEGNFLINTTTDAGFRLDVNGTARFQGNVTISTKDIVTDTTTGSKIATGNTQKLGFWNAAPISQPTTAVAAATRVGGGGTTLTDTDTFDGYTLAQVVKALRNAGLLA